MMKIIQTNSQAWEKLINRGMTHQPRVEEAVRKIIADIRTEGDAALLRYTRKFDKAKLTQKQIQVTEAETAAAFQNIEKSFVVSLKRVFENVNKYYKRQVKKSWRCREGNGIVMGEQVIPLERVGVYVPAGTAPLVSTVYMSVLPAKVAGVKEIILVTPPNAKGEIDPHILVVASLLKVDAVYKAGGAQAIAAMALGTKTIPKVDKIVGPGNAYVTEAKRQVFGYAGIDMLAGPTEIALLADRHANPDYVAADLAAENEHFQAVTLLVTTSKVLAKAVQKRVDGGYIVIAKSLAEAVDIVNQFAAEHLEILVKRPDALIRKITTSGAIFVGPYAPVPLGDYAAGPSHVLPTGGCARFFSGLGVHDFIKTSHVVKYSRKALESVREAIVEIAEIEKLPAHAQSIRVRFDKEES